VRRPLWSVWGPSGWLGAVEAVDSFTALVRACVLAPGLLLRVERVRDVGSA
jgi:hypothetical protein